MNKLLTLSLLSFTIACSAWAEKYEYVKLRADGSSQPIELITLNTAWDNNINGNYQRYVYDQVELGNGDVAKILSGVNHSVVFDDGDDVYMINFNDIYNPQTMCVGPGRICLISNSESFSDYRSSTVTIAIQRASDTGSKTLAWNGTEWEGSSDGSQQANNGVNPTSIKYDELLGWAYFTDTNWVYSYTNLSWYYMHPTSEGFYVWNANLPDNGWMKLERG